MDNIIKKIGDEWVLVLPDDLVKRNGWKEGDIIFASFLEDGLKIQRAWRGTLDPDKIKNKFVYNRHPV